MKKLLVALMVILSTGAMAQQKIGHVNSQKLLDTLPSRKVAMKTLKEFEESGTKELMEMEDDLNKSYSIYMEKEKSLAPIMQKIEQEKLQKKQQNIAEREQSLNREMQAISQSLNEPILDRIKRAVKIVAERKKLNYVIDETNTLYFDAGTDITDEVIKELLIIDAKEK